MAKQDMEVVKGVDLARYMGRWYEIASIPSRNQPKNGANTRATYTLKDDGTVNVLNETWSDGKRGYIEGTAFKADPKSDEAKLKVKFWVPPFLPIIPVTGDYWILFLDDDYQYALIGQPSKKNLWILCRQSHLDEEIYNQLVEKAKGEGYDVAKLKKTTHTEPPPETEDAPADNKGDLAPVIIGSNWGVPHRYGYGIISQQLVKQLVKQLGI
ncbi:temperature-induced lipocalin-1-like protein [Tanacetum coccineum]